MHSLFRNLVTGKVSIDFLLDKHAKTGAQGSINLKQLLAKNMNEDD